jgi:hypothetical protein
VLDDRIFEEAEQSRRIQEALNSLPPSLSQVLALHYLDGLSYAEIAAALDVPLSTVKDRLFKSRSRLHRGLIERDLVAPGQRQHAPRKGAKMQAAVSTTDADLVPVFIASIRKNVLAPARVVYLQEEGGDRKFSIIVGVPEAEAMAVKLLN